MNYANLIQNITENIKTNGSQAITAQVLQNVLVDMVGKLGQSGSLLGGVIDTSFVPNPTNDAQVVYIAEGPGTYTNFNGLVVGAGEVAFFYFNGNAWVKSSVDVVEVVNNLNSTATDKALSAAMGKQMGDNISQLEQDLLPIQYVEFKTADEIGYYSNTTGAFVSNPSLKTVIFSVERNDVVLAKLKIDADASAIGFKTSLSDSTIDINRVTPGVDVSTKHEYLYIADKDGYVFITSRENPIACVKKLGKIDDTFFQLKYTEQEKVYPIIGKAVYLTGADKPYKNALTDNNARFLFFFFVKPGTTGVYTIENSTELSVVYHGAAFLSNRLIHTGASFVDASLSYTSGTLTIVNNSSDIRAAVVVFKKSNGTTITSADAVKINQIYFRRIGDSIETYPSANTEFVALMNQYATRLGMTHSTFVNPYGGVPSTSNISCVSDILKMSIFAFGKEYVRRMMAMKSVSIAVLGDHAGTRAITKSTQSTMDSYYSEMHTGETNPYILLGDKGGGWSSGEYKAFSLVAFTKIEGKIVCGVTATTQGDATTGRVARVKGMIELFDIAAKVIRSESIAGLSCTFVENAIAAIVPEYPNCYSQISITPLYSQNPDVTYNPASTSKILSCIIMSDVLTNLQEYHKLSSEDIVNDSSYTAYAGDIETVETSLYAMMMASNAANTLSLARMAGTKILESKYKYVSQ